MLLAVPVPCCLSPALQVNMADSLAHLTTSARPMTTVDPRLVQTGAKDGAACAAVFRRSLQRSQLRFGSSHQTREMDVTHYFVNRPYAVVAAPNWPRAWLESERFRTPCVLTSDLMCLTCALCVPACTGRPYTERSTLNHDPSRTYRGHTTGLKPQYSYSTKQYDRYLTNYSL